MKPISRIRFNVDARSGASAMLRISDPERGEKFRQLLKRPEIVCPVAERNSCKTPQTSAPTREVEAPSVKPQTVERGQVTDSPYRSTVLAGDHAVFYTSSSGKSFEEGTWSESCKRLNHRDDQQGAFLPDPKLATALISRTDPVVTPNPFEKSPVGDVSDPRTLPIRTSGVAGLPEPLAFSENTGNASTQQTTAIAIDTQSGTGLPESVSTALDRQAGEPHGAISREVGQRPGAYLQSSTGKTQMPTPRDQSDLLNLVGSLVEAVIAHSKGRDGQWQLSMWMKPDVLDQTFLTLAAQPGTLNVRFNTSNPEVNAQLDSVREALCRRLTEALSSTDPVSVSVEVLASIRERAYVTV